MSQPSKKCWCRRNPAVACLVRVSMDFLATLVTAYLHRQWLTCSAPGQQGLPISSRSSVTCGSNHRTRINVMESLKILVRSSLWGSGSAIGRLNTGRDGIELRPDTSKKQIASPQSAFFFFYCYPGTHTILSFLLSFHEQCVTASSRVVGRIEGILGVCRPEDFAIPSSN